MKRKGEILSIELTNNDCTMVVTKKVPKPYWTDFPEYDFFREHYCANRSGQLEISQIEKGTYTPEVTESFSWERISDGNDSST